MTSVDASLKGSPISSLRAATHSIRNLTQRKNMREAIDFSHVFHPAQYLRPYTTSGYCKGLVLTIMKSHRPHLFSVDASVEIVAGPYHPLDFGMVTSK